MHEFFLFFLILLYDQTEKCLSEKISYFLRCWSETTSPQSPRRAAVLSPESPSATQYIPHMECFTVCKELSRIFSYLSLTKVV